jgi:hypothetical protein
MKRTIKLKYIVVIVLAFIILLFAVLWYFEVLQYILAVHQELEENPNKHRIQKIDSLYY